MLRGEEWPCRSLQAFSAAGRAGFEQKKLNFSLDNFFFIDYIARTSKTVQNFHELRGRASGPTACFVRPASSSPFQITLLRKGSWAAGEIGFNGVVCFLNWKFQ
jgi:hypothetical protein